MAWSRLALYNVAAIAAGERPVDSLTENSELRRKLDEVYTRGNGVIAWAMEQGHWDFAMRALEIDSDSAVSPAFGWTYAFSKPSDVRKLNMIASDEHFGSALTQYEDEAGYWFANVDPIYVRYVSDDVDYGADFAKWPDSFARWLGHHMAAEIAPGLTGEIDIERLEKRTRRLLVEARSNDATQGPPRFPALSSWASSRLNSPRGRRDRGSRARLLG